MPLSGHCFDITVRRARKTEKILPLWEDMFPGDSNTHSLFELRINGPEHWQIVEILLEKFLAFGFFPLEFVMKKEDRKNAGSQETRDGERKKQTEKKGARDSVSGEEKAKAEVEGRDKSGEERKEEKKKGEESRVKERKERRKRGEVEIRALLVFATSFYLEEKSKSHFGYEDYCEQDANALANDCIGRLQACLARLDSYLSSPVFLMSNVRNGDLETVMETTNNYSVTVESQVTFTRMNRERGGEEGSERDGDRASIGKSVSAFDFLLHKKRSDRSIIEKSSSIFDILRKKNENFQSPKSLDTPAKILMGGKGTPRTDVASFLRELVRALSRQFLFVVRGGWRMQQNLLIIDMETVRSCFMSRLLESAIEDPEQSEQEYKANVRDDINQIFMQLADSMKSFARTLKNTRSDVSPSRMRVVRPNNGEKRRTSQVMFLLPFSPVSAERAALLASKEEEKKTVEYCADEDLTDIDENSPVANVRTLQRHENLMLEKKKREEDAKTLGVKVSKFFDAQQMEEENFDEDTSSLSCVGSRERDDNSLSLSEEERPNEIKSSKKSNSSPLLPAPQNYFVTSAVKGGKVRRNSVSSNLREQHAEQQSNSGTGASNNGDNAGEFLMLVPQWETDLVFRQRKAETTKAFCFTFFHQKNVKKAVNNAAECVEREVSFLSVSPRSPASPPSGPSYPATPSAPSTPSSLSPSLRDSFDAFSPRLGASPLSGAYFDAVTTASKSPLHKNSQFSIKILSFTSPVSRDTIPVSR